MKSGSSRKSEPAPEKERPIGLPEWKAADARPRRVPTDTGVRRESFRDFARSLREKFRGIAELGALLESSDYDLVRIQRGWKRIAGPLGSASYPSRFKQDGVLEVLVESPVHAQELSLYQAEILRALKKADTPVTRLFIKNGRIPWDRLSGSSSPDSALKKERPRVASSRVCGPEHDRGGLAALLQGMKKPPGS